MATNQDRLPAKQHKQASVDAGHSLFSLHTIVVPDAPSPGPIPLARAQLHTRFPEQAVSRESALLVMAQMLHARLKNLS